MCGAGVKERSGESARKATKALAAALARSRGAQVTSGDDHRNQHGRLSRHVCSWVPNCDGPSFAGRIPARMSTTQVGDELVARGMDNMEVRAAL